MTWDLLRGWQWALLASIPPAIVLLYFLKLRREPLEVPSTYLWSRTVEDMHVNSIWQRLRRNLLLFLQLLLLFLAILACLNPNWRGSKLEDDRAIFLIDNSASASATDLGRSRLDEAKRQAKQMINSKMKSGDKGMIIAFSDADGARTIQSYTDNKRLLVSKLDSIKPTHRRTSLRQALRFASGLANPGRSSFGDSNDVAAASANPASLFIFSDGRVSEPPQFSIGNLKPEYIPLGKSDAKNVGITAFQAAKNPEKPDQLQVFAGLKNYGGGKQNIELELYQDEKMIDASSIELDSLAEGGREFSLNSTETGVLRLKIEAKDDFDVDDQAFVVLDSTQRSNLLIVTEGNLFLTGAFTTERMAKFADVKIAKPDHLATDEYKEAAADGSYDLVIFDQCKPATSELLPLANTVFFGAIPPASEVIATDQNVDDASGATDAETLVGVWQTEDQIAGPTIIDVDQSHPVMQFVNIGNILIGDAYPLLPPKGAISLIDSDVGTIAAIATRDSFQDLVLGFGLLGRGNDGSEYYNTTWVRNDPSYPVFIQNLLNYLGGVSESETQAIYRPGQLIQLRLDTASKQLSMRTPDGETRQVGRGRSGAFAFSSADRIGIYELRDPAAPDELHRIAVNLFDENESNIAPVPELKLDENVAIAGNAKGVQTIRREAWKWLVMLALIVLLVEWYIYNRRVYL